MKWGVHYVYYPHVPYVLQDMYCRMDHAKVVDLRKYTILRLYRATIVRAIV